MKDWDFCFHFGKISFVLLNYLQVNKKRHYLCINPCYNVSFNKESNELKQPCKAERYLQWNRLNLPDEMIYIQDFRTSNVQAHLFEQKITWINQFFNTVFGAYKKKSNIVRNSSEQHPFSWNMHIRIYIFR